MSAGLGYSRLRAGVSGPDQRQGHSPFTVGSFRAPVKEEPLPAGGAARGAPVGPPLFVLSQASTRGQRARGDGPQGLQTPLVSLRGGGAERRCWWTPEGNGGSAGVHARRTQAGGVFLPRGSADLEPRNEEPKPEGRKCVAAIASLASKAPTSQDWGLCPVTEQTCASCCPRGSPGHQDELGGEVLRPTRTGGSSGGSARP